MKIKKSMDNLKKIKDFDEKYQGSSERIRLSMEVFNARQSLNLNQQELAEKIKTTQKIISKIESADYNPGMDLLGRIIKKLQFTTDHLARIFGCPKAVSIIYVSKSENSINQYQIPGIGSYSYNNLFDVGNQVYSNQ